MDEMCQEDVQFVLLGSGDCHYEEQLKAFAQKYPDKMRAVIGFDAFASCTALSRIAIPKDIAELEDADLALSFIVKL